MPIGAFPRLGLDFFSRVFELLVEWLLVKELMLWYPYPMW